MALNTGRARLASDGFKPTLSAMKYHVLLGVVAVGACASSNVKPLGPRRDAKPIGCAVSFFPGDLPNYEYVDIASVQTRCRYSTNRVGCADELRAAACSLGGDTVYGFARAATRDHTLVSAKVAYRRKGADVQASAVTCAPACGPGLKCEEGECVPSCSPNCTDSQMCRARGTCGMANASAAESTRPALPPEPAPAATAPETVTPLPPATDR
jgi:hypothetical protein